MSIERVVFFNHCNNGDLHLSRELVKYAMKLLGSATTPCFYCHKNSPRILQDIDGLEQRALDAFGALDQEQPSFERNDTLFLNTWYAVSPVWNKGAGFGCTLNTLYELFKAHCAKWFGHTITEPVEHFIPRVDWSEYSRCCEWNDLWDVHRREASLAPISPVPMRRHVLVSNGQPRSGQTRIDEGAFTRAVGEWIDAHPEAMFLVSNQEGALAAPRKNVRFTSDLVGLPAGMCDLVETGYLSTFCDVIVGRASGAYSFAYLAENFLNPHKTMVCFTDDEKTARWIYPPDVVKARILWSPTRDYEGARALLAEAL